MMEEFDKFPYFFEEDIKIIAHCPFCEAKLNPVKAKVVENKENLSLIHIQCPKCQGYILALVFGNQMGINSIGLITDLSFRDLARLKNKSRIEADELLELYLNLNRKDILNKILALK